MISNSSNLRKLLILMMAAVVFAVAIVGCGKRPPPPPPPTPPPASTSDRERTPVEADAPEPILVIQIEPEEIQPGEAALLTWDSQHATQVTIEPAIGVVEVSGRIKFFPDQTSTYVVNAEGPGGVTSRSVTIRVTGQQTIAGTVEEEDLRGLSSEERFDAFIKPIFFPFDSAELSAEAKVALDGNARWLLLPENRSMKFVLEGHADERGSEEYNLALGDQRAMVVLEYLVGRGIERDRLTAVSLGEEKPFDQRSSEEAYALNRRTQFVFLGR